MSSKRVLIALALILSVGAIPKTMSVIRGANDYATAERRIDDAIQDGKTVLNFKDLKYLTRIPDSVRQVNRLRSLTAVSANRLSDINSLNGLPELKFLYLGDTRIADLTPLATLQSLEVLDIRDTWISDLEPLTALPRLRWLQMNRLGVKSLCPLNSVRFLSWLNLHKSYAEDGSTDCFFQLERKVADLGGGASYKQSYIPGQPYLWKVSLERFLEWLEWR